MRRAYIILIGLIFISTSVMAGNSDLEKIVKKLSNIESKLENLSEDKDAKDTYAHLGEFKKDLKVIETELANYITQKIATFSDEDLQSIITDIEYLKAENLYLRYKLDNGTPQYVSTSSSYRARQTGYDFETRLAKVNKIIDSINTVPGFVSDDITFTGFFDLQTSFSNTEKNRPDFGMGQAELGIKFDHSKNVGLDMAITYDNEDGVFELGVAEMSLKLYNNSFAFISSIELKAGQFYVPFGIDYHFRPSLDRKLVTPPFFNEVHNGWQGWNDAGLQLGITGRYSNWVGYAVNGFGDIAMILDTVQSLATGADVFEEIDTSPSYAIGNRLGITPFENFEFGGSIALGLNKSDKTEMILSGLDFMFDNTDIMFKGEYYHHTANKSIDEVKHYGYYIEAFYKFGNPFLSGRVGAYKIAGNNWQNNYTLGLGYSITENFEIRLESIIFEHSELNQNTLQLATGF